MSEDTNKEMTAAEKRKATIEAKKAAKEAEEKAEKEKDTTSDGTTQTTSSTPASYRLRILNNSQSTQIIPISKGRRISIMPGQHYDPADEDYDAIKKYVQTPFFKSLLDLKRFKLVDVPLSRRGDPNYEASKTPEAPKDLKDLPEHVTKADFVTDEGK